MTRWWKSSVVEGLSLCLLAITRLAMAEHRYLSPHHISPRTAETRRTNLLRKLGLSSQHKLIQCAV